MPVLISRLQLSKELFCDAKDAVVFYILLCILSFAWRVKIRLVIKPWWFTEKIILTGKKTFTFALHNSKKWQRIVKQQLDLFLSPC